MLIFFLDFDMKNFIDTSVINTHFEFVFKNNSEDLWLKKFLSKILRDSIQDGPIV